MTAAALAASTVMAQDLRFERLTYIEDSDGTPPIVFWRDGRLCIEHDPTRATCHAVLEVVRPELRFVSMSTKSQRLVKRLKTRFGTRVVELENSGAVRVDETYTSVARLRCGLGRLRELNDFRFVVGSREQLSIVALEEDDTRLGEAAEQAYHPPLSAFATPTGDVQRRVWVILYAVETCRE